MSSVIERGTVRLAETVFGSWVHAFEEDTDGVEVMRPVGSALPPALGRDGFEIAPGGDFVHIGPGPADEPVRTTGRWTASSLDRVTVTFDGLRPDLVFSIVETSADVLRIRREPIIQPQPGSWQLAERTSLQAWRIGPFVLLVAEGTIPTPGFEVRITQNPIRIFPAQYDLQQRARPGIWPQVVTVYREAAIVRHPREIDTITVHHAAGTDTVDIGTPEASLRPLVAAVGTTGEPGAAVEPTESTGFSGAMSFDEAFADALAGLPPFSPSVPDELERIRVVETGALRGGIAGFHHLFVRLVRVTDSDSVH